MNIGCDDVNGGGKNNGFKVVMYSGGASGEETFDGNGSSTSTEGEGGEGEDGNKSEKGVANNDDDSAVDISFPT